MVSAVEVYLSAHSWGFYRAMGNHYTPAYKVTRRLELAHSESEVVKEVSMIPKSVRIAKCITNIRLDNATGTQRIRSLGLDCQCNSHRYGVYDSH